MTDTTNAVGTDLDRLPAFTLERGPIFDSLHPRQVALLKQMSPNINDAELAMGLELAWAYKLDPYAREVHFVKSRGRDGREGRLLIMVGRDGLRKIAQRNHLDVDGDVVRKNDTFKVQRLPDRTRAITHVYAEGDRGEVVGAWAECYEHGGRERQRGFFYAPLHEYRPANLDGHSPWSKQVSVMILAAAERQAVRQATPLGGLLVEGEDDVIEGTASEAQAARLVAPVPSWGPKLEGGDLDPLMLHRQVEDVLERAREVGHVGLSDRANAEMSLRDQPPDRWVDWVSESTRELDRHEQAQPSAVEPPEEVVDAEPAGGHEDEAPPRPEGVLDDGSPRCEASAEGLGRCELEGGHEGHHRVGDSTFDSYLDQPSDAERHVADLVARAQSVGDLIDEAVASEQFERATELSTELDQINEAIAAARGDDDAEQLPL